LTPLIQFGASFAAVFLKGFQHQNVIGGKYVAAFFFSYMMSAADVVVIYFVAKTGWDSMIPVGTGASLGIVSSMLLYRWLHTKVSG
jgi:hypothetical protein